MLTACAQTLVASAYIEVERLVHLVYIQTTRSRRHLEPFGIEPKGGDDHVRIDIFVQRTGSCGVDSTGYSSSEEKEILRVRNATSMSLPQTLTHMRTCFKGDIDRTRTWGNTFNGHGTYVQTI